MELNIIYRHRHVGNVWVINVYSNFFLWCCIKSGCGVFVELGVLHCKRSPSGCEIRGVAVEALQCGFRDHGVAS